MFVEPTLTADEMQPGEEIANGMPLLPEATTVATPIERKLSMIGLYGSLLHGEVNNAPPRLMLTAAMSCAPPRATAYTRSSPAITSEEKAPMHGATPPQLAGSMTLVKT